MVAGRTAVLNRFRSSTITNLTRTQFLSQLHLSHSNVDYLKSRSHIRHHSLRDLDQLQNLCVSRAFSGTVLPPLQYCSMWSSAASSNSWIFWLHNLHVGSLSNISCFKLILKHLGSLHLTPSTDCNAALHLSNRFVTA